MKLSTLSIIISTITAQISFGRSDNTASVIDSTPGCYPIIPAILIANVNENFKVEFYNDYNCQGSKAGEASDYSVFEAPIHAISAKFIKTSEVNNEVNEIEGVVEAVEEAINNEGNQTSNERNSSLGENSDKYEVKDKETNIEGYHEKVDYADFTLNKYTKYKIGNKKINKEDLANYESAEFEKCEKNEAGEYDEECVSYDDLFDSEDGDSEGNDESKAEGEGIISNEKPAEAETIKSENKEDEVDDDGNSSEVEGYVVSKCHH